MPAKRLGTYHVPGTTLEMSMHTIDSGQDVFHQPCTLLTRLLSLLNSLFVLELYNSPSSTSLVPTVSCSPASVVILGSSQQASGGSYELHTTSSYVPTASMSCGWAVDSSMPQFVSQPTRDSKIAEESTSSDKWISVDPAVQSTGPLRMRHSGPCRHLIDPLGSIEDVEGDEMACRLAVSLRDRSRVRRLAHNSFMTISVAGTGYLTWNEFKGSYRAVFHEEPSLEEISKELSDMIEVKLQLEIYTKLFCRLNISTINK
ncbi:unnamed protein product [Protopolystoma xenopodis]|uniref:EF-hand domain-containing protein n=1 Tax=Protopolystoma xenopodis TaxID=117903 RepID=A0A3S5CB78_9PLAT|nr:unnamed protein product [Protopolystoma xenopodis]